MSEADGFTFLDVVVERGGRRALDGFSARVPKIGVTAVFGPSGSGKSTPLRLCNRLDREATELSGGEAGHDTGDRSPRHIHGTITR